MSEELLRRAATAMRDRAKKATGAPWKAEAARVAGWGPPDPPVVWGAGEPVTESWHLRYPNAVHIASWDPSVALAVANWLEVEADCMQVWAGVPQNYRKAAIEVARAFLGVDSE